METKLLAVDYKEYVADIRTMLRNLEQLDKESYLRQIAELTKDVKRFKEILNNTLDNLEYVQKQYDHEIANNTLIVADLENKTNQLTEVCAEFGLEYTNITTARDIILGIKDVHFNQPKSY